MGGARSDNRDRLNELINKHTRTASSDAWIARLNEAGIPSGPINSIDKVFATPQVQHLGLAQDVVSQERGATQLVGQPIKMSRAESGIRQPPPLAGQHNDEILADLGYNDDQIAQFRTDGVI